MSVDMDRPSPRLRRRVPTAGWHVILTAVVAIFIFPVLWALLTSFKPDNEIFSTTPVAQSPTLGNYVEAFTTFPILRLLGNTTVMALGVAAGQVVIAVLAAFALVHVTPRRRPLFLGVLVVAMAVPAQTVIIPQFLLAAELGWRNTQAGLIVPQLGGCALAVLLLVQNVTALPPSQVRAARVDGARDHEVLRLVVLPGLRPAMASVFILVFISTWNEYLWPLLVAGRMEDTTIQLGLSMFVTAEGNDYGGLLAASTLTTLPVVVVYLLASRRITEAFLASGDA